MLERADVAWRLRQCTRLSWAWVGHSITRMLRRPTNRRRPPPNPAFAGGGNPFAGGAAARAAEWPSPIRTRSPMTAYAVADDAAPGTYTYTLIKSGPDVNPDEVELGHVTAVEVMILWDTTVLHVQHLTPPRSFYVGEEEGKNFACDYFIPSEKIGTTRAPIVLADHGSINFVILPRARGTVEIPNQPKMTLEDAVRSGRTQPCAELSGAQQMALPSGGKARMEVDGLVFQISAVPAGKPLVHGVMASTDFNTLLYVGLSLLAHIGLIAAMAFFVPPMGLTDDEGLSRDQQYLIQQYLQAAAEREQEQKETEQVAETNADNKEGGTGTRAKGEEGSMGNPTTKETGHRYGVQGPQDNPDPHIARQAALREAAEFGMIGLVRAQPQTITGAQGRGECIECNHRRRCADMRALIRQSLLAGYVCERNPETGFPLFAFRLHQFVSRGDTAYATIESEGTRYLTVRAQQFAPGSEKKSCCYPWRSAGNAGKPTTARGNGSTTNQDKSDTWSPAIFAN